MLTIVRNIFKKSIVRYIFIGGISFLIELGVIFLASHIFSAPPLLAVAISFWVGLAVSFVLQKVITFQNKEKGAKKLAWQMVAYGILIVVNYTFTLLAVATLEDVVGTYIARTIALIVTTIWNYIVYSKVIFRREDGK